MRVRLSMEWGFMNDDVASKWIGLYAGAGLAVAFFTTLFKRYREYEWARKRFHAE